MWSVRKMRSEQNWVWVDVTGGERLPSTSLLCCCSSPIDHLSSCLKSSPLGIDWALALHSSPNALKRTSKSRLHCFSPYKGVDSTCPCGRDCISCQIMAIRQLVNGFAHSLWMGVSSFVPYKLDPYRACEGLEMYREIIKYLKLSVMFLKFV